jgi:hypothetical protein
MAESTVGRAVPVFGAASYITGTELVIDGGITGGAITRTGPLAVRPD